jgi:hypothetical protein
MKGGFLIYNCLTVTIIHTENPKELCRITRLHNGHHHLIQKVLQRGFLPRNCLFNLRLMSLLLLITVAKNYCFRISGVIPPHFCL